MSTKEQQGQESPTTRTFKVTSGYYSNVTGKQNPHPVIRLYGHALLKSNFNIGDSFEVTYEADQITITKTK